jgi:serine/threonine protein kinase
MTYARTLPPLPEAPVFDMPVIPILNPSLNATNFPPFAGMTEDQIFGIQLGVANAVLRGARQAALSLGLTLMLGWLLMLVTCGFLLFNVRRNRHRALRGDVTAAHKIVLPAFEPLLWLLCGANLLYMVAYTPVLLTGNYLTYLTKISIEIMSAGKHFNFLLVPIYLLQPSLSIRALRVALLQTVVFSSYAIPVPWLLNTYLAHEHERLCYWIVTVSRTPVLLFFCYLFVWPPSRASVRTMREFCGYVITMILLLNCAAESFHRGSNDVASTLGWVIMGYTVGLPVVVWRVLRADTEYWRGIGQRAVELQELFRRKNGKIDERTSSQGLHVLIEMHRKYIIDFAYLQIREHLGEGDGVVSVFRGFLTTKKIAVAIKAYMPSTFTEETVAQFSHEAALCGALVHSNIVTFHGVCVCPPHICLVTELCQGSLQDVADAHVARPIYHSSVPRRKQGLIRLGFMIDAARALAYLHSFSPPFVHRDIRPSSFLVDDNGTVKLTDFGASRTLTALHGGGGGTAPVPLTTVMSPTVRTNSPVSLDVPGVVINATKCTAQYMAPEMIKSHHAGTNLYGEAADVYSLAITMWDILYPGRNKYELQASPTTGRGQALSDSDVFEQVLAGQRPPFGTNVHRGLRELIEIAWHADPRMRPSVQSIVASLETIQEELCAEFALEFMDELSNRNDRDRQAGQVVASHSSKMHDPSSSFAGTHAVETLRLCDFVDSQSEAIRLGNMLMDAGFLHHTKHARSFAYAGSQYVFDVDQLLLCQPLTLLEMDGPGDLPHSKQKQPVRVKRDSAVSRRNSQQLSVLMESVTGARPCACRKLGRRFETERTVRRGFRRMFNGNINDHGVTARLLANDLPLTTTSGSSFKAFQEPSVRGANGFASESGVSGPNVR